MLKQNQFLIAMGIMIFIIAMLIIGNLRKEGFAGYHHRSNLASTFWIKKPQVQHTFKDLKLQYPCHKKYFEVGCDEKEPSNAEVCRYHKHRFDPNQL